MREKQSSMVNALKVLEVSKVSLRVNKAHRTCGSKLMEESLTKATEQLSNSLAPQIAFLPDIDSQLSNLTIRTREGRTAANILKRRVETSRYQTDRLLEGTDRLEHTLETYRKRMEDVEQAVEGLYTLEPYTADEKESEEAEQTEQEADTPDDGGSLQPSRGDQNPLIRWLAFLTG